MVSEWLEIRLHFGICQDCKNVEQPIELIFWQIDYGAICADCARKRGLLW